jgi:hypothetical protein
MFTQTESIVAEELGSFLWVTLEMPENSIACVRGGRVDCGCIGGKNQG